MPYLFESIDILIDFTNLLIIILLKHSGTLYSYVHKALVREIKILNLIYIFSIYILYYFIFIMYLTIYMAFNIKYF